ncbi:hypothetical protein J7E97_01380 [Streptomyces sp. ISL-66]|uniref:hypothetical protein n=1 Tax=Streptomyces sp. ISL-66 TaxID=2819186 RepID=UPI001BE98883|nr:hypothetical protein [Streptomyces sp. ISL-66]MBT2466547.1 hypothetical protein [Streptomyces sp. ISL-66]
MYSRTPRRCTVDRAAVLVRCSICEALVPHDDVESGTFIWCDEDGHEQTARRRTCSDAAACYLLSNDSTTWERLGGSLPVGVEPPPGARVVKCTACDVAARVDDLDIARVLDDIDDVWYSSVTCADEDACYDRQVLYPYRPHLPE